MKNNEIKVHAPNELKGRNRRQFLKMSGMALAGAGLLFACKDDDDMEPSNPNPGVFDLGSGDLGILNYAFALEQLEAAFYTKVVNNFYPNISDEEQTVLTDLYNHEVIHRDLYAAALPTVASESQITPSLEFNFDSIDFNNREMVLTTSKVLEDTGVKAYNGAGKYLSNADYLVLAGKIVSVEARHASAIASLLNPDSSDFAGDDVLVDLGGSGLAYDAALPPSEILQAVGDTGFITTEFTANNLA